MTPSSYKPQEPRVAPTAVEEVEAAEEVAVEVGVVPGVGASVAAVEVVAAVAEVVEAAAVVVEVAAEVVLVVVQPRSVEAMVAASASSSCAPVRPRLFNTFVSGTLGVGGLGVQVPALTFFAPALVVGSVPPDPGIAAAALGASTSAAPGSSASAVPGAGASALSGTAPTESLHTFTLESGASHSFFRDSTKLTPLSRPIAVSLADPSGGPVLAHSSTVLPSAGATDPRATGAAASLGYRKRTSGLLALLATRQRAPRQRGRRAESAPRSMRTSGLHAEAIGVTLGEDNGHTDVEGGNGGERRG
ncbi:unnamed protein product [Closterium sp. NIES-53]